MRAHWIDDESTTLTADDLTANGLVYEFLGTEAADYQPKLDVYKQERGYGTQDEVALSAELANLDEICAKFDKEHLHTDDEVRFVLAGEGIFDVRSTDDRWMRVVVEPGDLIIVPADKHHRFLLTEKRHIRCLRLFQDQSGWVPVYRKTADRSN